MIEGRSSSESHCWRSDVPNRAEFAEEVEEFFRGDVEAAHRLDGNWSGSSGQTNLRFFTNRALQGKKVLAEVV